MKLSGRKAIGWLLFTVAIGAVVWGAIEPRRVIRDTPMMHTMNRLHQICGALPYYAEEHDGGSLGHGRIETVEALIGAGVIGPEDAAFLQTNGFEFHGFDPHKIGEDIAVFEMVFTNTPTPRRLVGYSDGHVVAWDVERKP